MHGTRTYVSYARCTGGGYRAVLATFLATAATDLSNNPQLLLIEVTGNGKHLTLIICAPPNIQLVVTVVTHLQAVLV